MVALKCTPNPPDLSASAPTEQPCPQPHRPLPRFPRGPSLSDPLPCPATHFSPTAQPHRRAHTLWGREKAKKHQQTQESGNRAGNRVWGEAEPHLGWGSTPQGKHRHHSCTSPVWGLGAWGNGGALQWGRDRAALTALGAVNGQRLFFLLLEGILGRDRLLRTAALQHHCPLTPA